MDELQVPDVHERISSIKRLSTSFRSSIRRAASIGSTALGQSGYTVATPRLGYFRPKPEYVDLERLATAGAVEAEYEPGEEPMLPPWRRWVVLLSVMMCQLIGTATPFSLAVVFVEAMDAYNTTRSEAAWVSSIALAMVMIGAMTDQIGTKLGYMEIYIERKQHADAGIMRSSLWCKGIPSGYLIATLGPRRTTRIGGFLAALGMAISFPSPNIYFLYFSIGFCVGFGMSMVQLVSVTVVAPHFPELQGLVISMIMASRAFGSLAYPIFITELNNQLGWRGGLLIWSGLLLQIVVLGAFVTPALNWAPRRMTHSCTSQKDRTENARNNNNDGPKGDYESFNDYGNLDSFDDDDRPLYMFWTYNFFVVSYILVSMQFGVLNTCMMDMYIDRQISKVDSAIIVLAYNVGNAVGRIFSGLLEQFTGVTPMMIMAGATLIQVGLLAIYPLTNTYMHYIVVSVALGLMTGSIISQMAVAMLVLVQMESRFIEGFAIISTMSGVFMLFSAPLAGWIRDIFGDYTVSLRVCAGIMLVGGLGFVVLCIRNAAQSRSYDLKKTPFAGYRAM